MISQTNKNSYALIFQDQKITFDQLNLCIDRKIPELSRNKVEFIKTSNTLECIVSILSALKVGKPIALFSEGIVEEKFQYSKELILKSSIHPETALILFTSGSSGDSKMVQLSKKNIDANTKAVIEALDFEKIEAQALFLPLSYSYGLLGQLLPALELGKTTYILDHMIKIKALVENNLVQMISAVPSQHIVLLKILNNTKSLSHIISAGAPLHLNLRKELVKKFNYGTIYNNYGQTELSPRALSLKSSDPDFLTEATGRVVRGLEYKINEEGELLFKGKQVMLGYLGESYSQIEWHNTGDLAQEKDGLITIKGRKDSLVKIAGQRISLKFLEAIIEKEKNVNHVAILYKEDELYGQKLFLFYEGSLLEKEVLEVFKRESGLSIIPEKIIKLDKVPKNTNGKIDYQALKQNI